MEKVVDKQDAQVFAVATVSRRFSLYSAELSATAAASFHDFLCLSSAEKSAPS